jgi:hypothetical protein
MSVSRLFFSNFLSVASFLIFTRTCIPNCFAHPVGSYTYSIPLVESVIPPVMTALDRYLILRDTFLGLLPVMLVDRVTE